jgi:hypothetical protein
MIDSIVLTLTRDMYHISDPDKFTPSARWALPTATSVSSAFQSKQIPTKKELLCGIYKPRLMLTNRLSYRNKQEVLLKVELSVPKLMFGNNFTELRYKDFVPVVEKLVSTLETMGVSTTAHMLAKAPVSAIHYAKNIPLTDGSTPYHYINKIKEANVKLVLDVNQTDYRNEGHSYKWHCNSYEVAFYNKIKDLEYAKQSSKRALEKDSVLQLNLLKALRVGKKKFEVLRMEVRLNKRQKIKQLFGKLGIAADITFKKLLKPAIAKKVLLHYLDELESQRPLLLDYKPKSEKALLVDLVMNNPELKPKKLFQLYGLKQALAVMNPRELRMLLARYPARSWYELMGEANKVQLPAVSSPFKDIRAQLEAFKAITKF